MSASGVADDSSIEMDDDGSFTPLVSPIMYQEYGIDVGTTQKSAHMQRFISHVRDDGIFMLDWRQTDHRIRVVAQFLAQYQPDEILVACSRPFGHKPARNFAESIGALHAIGRFVPGKLTNPRLESFIEPSVVITTDPAADGQVINEALRTGLPVVSLVDANNMLRNVDLALPVNNKGRSSLALVYWLLGREINKARGVITDNQTWEELHNLEEWKSLLG